MKKPSFAKYVERHDRINTQEFDLHEWWPFGGGNKKQAAPAPQAGPSKAARDYSTASAVDGLRMQKDEPTPNIQLKREGQLGSFDSLETGLKTFEQGFAAFAGKKFGKHPSLEKPVADMQQGLTSLKTSYGEFMKAVQQERATMKANRPVTPPSRDFNNLRMQKDEPTPNINLSRGPKMSPPGTDRLSSPLGR